MPRNLFPPMPSRKQVPFEVIAPNLGLYLGRSELEVPDRAFVDCENVRIRNRKVTNQNVGHELLFSIALGDQVLLIALYRSSAGVNTTIFGTRRDLFRYDEGANTPLYITPAYTTGTVSVTSGSPIVTGSGTSWLANVKAGDKIYVGANNQDDIVALWYTVDTVDTDTQITLTENYGVSSASGQAYTIRQLFTASNLDFWDWDIFPDAPLGPQSGLAAGDHFYATNGTELIVWDGNAARVVVLSTSSSGLGFSCRTVCYFKNMMLYGYITESSSVRPSNFKNSAIADPENVTTLEANEQIAAESVDFILAMKRLGDYCIAYCENSVNVVQFIDNPFYFAIRTAAPRIGAFSGRTIVNFGDYHEFLAKDQAYQFDGARLLPFGNQVFDETLQRADRDRSEKALAAITEQDREVYWVVPLTSDGTGADKSAEKGWVEHYAEQVGSAPSPFTKRYLPATAIGDFLSSPLNRFSDFTGFTFDTLTQNFVSSYFSASFPILLMGDEDGHIYKMNTVTGFSDDPTAECFIETPTRPIVDGKARGVIRRAEPYLEKGSTALALEIRIRTQERVAGDKTSASDSVVLDHSGARFKSYRNAGLYASAWMGIQLQPESVFVMHGYRITGEALGDR